MSQWYESDNPTRVARGASWRIGVWIVAAVLFFAVIGIAIWGFKVGTSDVKGQGDAVRQKNSGTNRIAAQERFESLYAEIKAADRRLDPLAAAVKADPTSHVAQTNLAGAVSYCIGVVADYNAEARKYTSEDFRAVDLPEQIDDLNPETDCQETTP